MSHSMSPSIEERLTAAAFTILTDDHEHSLDAQRWAVRTLRSAARYRPTAFQQHMQPCESEGCSLSRQEH